MTSPQAEGRATVGPWRIVETGIVEMGEERGSLSFWAGLGYGGQLPNPSGQDPKVERDANARLIAAAPDYDEAADLMIAAEQSGGDLWWKGFEMLKAAHAKARGQS